MHETFALIVNHVRMIWRFRWTALCAAAVVCAVGWVAVIALPNQFEVATKVFLDTTSMLRPLLRGLALDNRAQQNAAMMMRRTLLVRPNLEAVARKTDMDLTAKTPEAFEELLVELASSINVSGTERDNIYVISYQNSDPELATRVVESILNLFVERSLGESRKDSGKTKQFVDKQIAEYEARLSAAEARVKEFKQQNVGLMPQEGRNYYSRLEQVMGQLSEAKLALDEATRRRDEYRRQIEGVAPLFETEITPTRTRAAVRHPLDDRIRALETSLDQLLLQYTDKHPDVIAARGMIEALAAQREAELASMPAPAQVDGLGEGSTESPVYQELSVALGSAEAEVAALAARVEEYTRRVAKLRELVDTVPRIEAELSRLNRDYEINKRNYEELVKRRESLQLSERASQTNDAVQFNVIEPPRVPLTPVGPNRPLLSSAVLVGALGFGIGIAWLIAVIRPAVYSKEEIGSTFNLPVLGTVSRLWTRKEMLRRRVEVATFVFGCVVLIGLFSGLLMLELSHNEILDSVRKLDVATRISKLVDGMI